MSKLLAALVLAGGFMAGPIPRADAQALGRGGAPLRVDPPRIAPLTDPEMSDEQRALLAPLARERGSVPNLYRTLVRHPKMFTPRYNFGHYIKQESTLAARDREILICRIAWLTGAEYEWSPHSAIGRQNGLTADDIRRIAAGPDAAGWSDADRPVVRAVDELFDEMFISDRTWQELSGRLKMDQMMDLVMTVGTYHMLGMALRSYGIPLEPSATRFAASREASWGQPVEAHPRGKPATPTRLATPRIAPIPEKDWTPTDRELLEPLEPLKRDRGYVGNVYGTLSRHPQMYRLWLAYARYILRESTLPAREREMLILRIAYRASGEYEWAAHSRLGVQAGLSEDEVARIRSESLAAGWNDADRTILLAVDQLHANAFIEDEPWRKLAARLNTQQMMDLVLTVGAYKMLAMALNSFGAQLDSGMVGFPQPGR